MENLNKMEGQVVSNKDELVKVFKSCMDQFYELPYLSEVSIDQHDNIRAIDREIHEVQEALNKLKDDISQDQLLALKDKINIIKSRFNTHQKNEGKEDLFVIE